MASPVQKYDVRADKTDSLLCVGLDSDFSKIPERFKSLPFPQFEFNKWVIEQTHDLASAYKLNSAFYEARGAQGISELKRTMEYLQAEHPDIFTVCDCKRADIGNSNRAYAEFFFDWLAFDSVTLHPYLGREALSPFLERKDKISIILCRTSNPGAGELQDLETGGKPLWQKVAEKVRDEWNENGNCMLVVGATYPSELKAIRELTGDMTFLVPGIGAQDGSIKDTVECGLNSARKGLIIHSARSIIFSENPRREAEKLKNGINSFIKK